jgi:hypothetical protein
MAFSYKLFISVGVYLGEDQEKKEGEGEAPAEGDAPAEGEAKEGGEDGDKPDGEGEETKPEGETEGSKSPVPQVCNNPINTFHMNYVNNRGISSEKIRVASLIFE